MSEKHYLESLRHSLELAAEEVLPPDEELRFRAMFGGMGAYARGRMFASLSGVGLALKLGPEARGRLLEQEGAWPLRYEEDGPVSKSYVVVPTAVEGEPRLLAPWVGRSIEYTATLPEPKRRRKKSPPKRSSP